MRSLLKGFGLIFLGYAALGCNRTSQAATLKARAKPAKPASAAVAAKAKPKPLTGPAKPLNVLLITIDSLRADMPWMGYPRKIAPNLTKLASKSIVFTDAYSVSSYTAKSLPALLASRYPSTLYRDGWFFTGYSPANLFFPELLQKRGIRTLAGMAHMYFKRSKGLAQGFDVWRLVPGITFDPQTDNDVTSNKLTKLAIDILKKPKNTGKQFFAWFHYMDPHDKYIKHKESPDWGNKARDRYDSEVFYTDLWIGKLLTWAKKHPWWKNTALIISADHGEAFGEHGEYRHAFALWQELTHVPLMFYFPGVKPRRIDAATSDIDLAPTICDMMGVPESKTFEGRDLVPELYGDVPPKAEIVMTDLPADSNNEEHHAIIDGDYKLIVYGMGYRYQLFDLKTDPGEKKDLAKTDKPELEKMKAVFKRKWSELPVVQAYGGMKLTNGKIANGPRGPAHAASKTASNSH